jgi:hypothetical protein
VNAQTVDTIAVQQPDRLPRRGTLISLAAALAAVTVPVPAAAKKRRKKKAKDLCQQQQGQCETVAAAICATAERPDACLRGMLPCCERLGTCDAGPAFECLLFPLV